MKLEATDYVMKPVDMPDLLDKIEATSEKRRLHEEKIRAAKVKRIISHPMTVLGESPEDGTER